LAKAFAAEFGPDAKRTNEDRDADEDDGVRRGRGIPIWPRQGVDAPEGAKEGAARELDRVKAVEAAEPTENEPAGQDSDAA
jgi:hypothetical protein